ncbi:hypothetical protein [Lacticaseibacillus absianus]|uniref:hypothetical protein n=1 Tax=Lacticaseibacillus absianus TaxID=2729623 RepID=UPI0015C85472|nr:hypothetical protein [Lacticaseibacillus absianus]
MEDVLGCLLEPLVELLVLPHFDPAHRRRARVQLGVALVIDGAAVAGSGWAFWQTLAARSWGLCSVALVMLGLFGTLLVNVLRRYARMRRGIV